MQNPSVTFSDEALRTIRNVLTREVDRLESVTLPSLRADLVSNRRDLRERAARLYPIYQQRLEEAEAAQALMFIIPSTPISL